MKLPRELEIRLLSINPELRVAVEHTMLAAIAYERERCAKVCDDAEEKWAMPKRGYTNEYEQGRVNMACELAAAIRDGMASANSPPHT